MELLSLEFPECLLKVVAVPLAAYLIIVLVVIVDTIRNLPRKP